MITLGTESQGLTIEALGATLVYSMLGILIMLTAIVLVNGMFKLDMHKELVKENNTAFGILIGCVSIAIAIIIGATILS